MNNNYIYYQIDNRKFSLEKISNDFYELTVFEGENFLGTYCFRGAKAYADALAEILSYAEIDEEDYDT